MLPSGTGVFPPRGAAQGPPLTEESAIAVFDGARGGFETADGHNRGRDAQKQRAFAEIAGTSSRLSEPRDSRAAT